MVYRAMADFRIGIEEAPGRHWHRNCGPARSVVSEQELSGSDCS